MNDDLKQMVIFYLDAFSGDCLLIKEAFQFMKDHGFVDENDEEIYEDEEEEESPRYRKTK